MNYCFIIFLYISITVYAVVETTPSGPVPGEDPLKLREDMLKLTNDIRKEHQVDVVKSDTDTAEHSELEKRATDRCNVIYALDDLADIHKDPNPYGENVYWYAKTTELPRVTSTEAMNYWNSEAKGIDFTKLNTSIYADHGHFTQLVWKATTHLGCARCLGQRALPQKPGYEYYVTVIVCEYWPPGNKLSNDTLIANVLDKI